MGAHLVLDDDGLPVDVEHVVAAEWVGILTSTHPGGTRQTLVPGGTVHAVPRTGDRTRCGIALDDLALFAADFGRTDWAPRCADCAVGVRSPAR